MFVLWKIWRALFSWNTHFKILPFALLPTKYDMWKFCQKSFIILKNRDLKSFNFCLVNLWFCWKQHQIIQLQTSIPLVPPCICSKDTDTNILHFQHDVSQVWIILQNCQDCGHIESLNLLLCFLVQTDMTVNFQNQSRFWKPHWRLACLHSV